jgi:cytochrome c oxidase subunit 4
MSASGAHGAGAAGRGATAHAAHGAEDIRAHVRVYMMVFGALAVLTVVTVGAFYLHVPIHIGITLALLIATVKASLVALFFMHLKGEVRAIFAALLLTAVFFLVLMTIPLSWYLDGPIRRGGGAPAAPAHATSHEAH